MRVRSHKQTHPLWVWLVILFSSAVLASGQTRTRKIPDQLANVHRILFLGDSITYAGEYVEDIQAYLSTRFPNQRFEILNLGLPSETVSGLSPVTPADGFLVPTCTSVSPGCFKTKPDLVFACYGMNDAIYEPFSSDHFRKFQSGMAWLHDKVAASGAQIILITPPTFDSVAAAARKEAEGKPASSSPDPRYNSVLDRYSDWLLAQRANGWEVIDLHEPMNQWLNAHRKQDPDFSYTRDGIHPDSAGHWFIAQRVLMFLPWVRMTWQMRPALMLYCPPTRTEATF